MFTLAPAAASPELILDYRRCTCLGRAPLRGCRACFSTGWLKRCADCLGLGTLSKTPRQANAAGRTERCGRCMGAGWTPCPMCERARAEEIELSAQGEIAETASATPSPAATEKRISARRKQIKKSRAKLLRHTAAGIDIQAERPQNPLEAMELAEEEPAPAIAAPAQEEVAPSSFSPEDFPPAA